jgi:Cys-tRNA(Pro) deacylase
VSAATPALRVLIASGLSFAQHPYAYVERGGTASSSAALGVDEHTVIKTLVFEDEAKRPLIVLMHGDRSVAPKALAAALGRRAAAPCAPEVAQKHTGYLVGGTSPFGLRKPIPICAEATIFDLEQVYINGGRRGLLVSMAPAALEALLKPLRVHVAAP